MLFLVLNSELFGMVGEPETPVPGPWTQQQQMGFIERVLNEHAEARWTIVLLHQPLWDTEGEIDADWRQVEQWLADRDHTVFAGHFHRYSRHQRNDQSYITLATTGGGSGLRGTAFGEFDHVAFVTMTADGPRIANLMLDGIEDADVANPETHAEAAELARPVHVQTRFVEPSGFQGTEMALVIDNPGAAPLTATPRFADSENLRVTTQPLPVEVPPGETRTVPVEVQALTADVAALRPATATWRIVTRVAGRDADFETRVPLLPVARHPTPVLDGITLDGRLDDWPGLPFTVATQGDVSAPATMPDDISFRFGVGRDERQGEPWQALRMTILANDFDEGDDFDEGGDLPTTLHWQPYRFGDAPADGTGLFVKGR